MTTPLLIHMTNETWNQLARFPHNSPYSKYLHTTSNPFSEYSVSTKLILINSSYTIQSFHLLFNAHQGKCMCFTVGNIYNLLDISYLAHYSHHSFSLEKNSPVYIAYFKSASLITQGLTAHGRNPLWFCGFVLQQKQQRKRTLRNVLKQDTDNQFVSGKERRHRILASCICCTIAFLYKNISE